MTILTADFIHQDKFTAIHFRVQSFVSNYSRPQVDNFIGISLRNCSYCSITLSAGFFQLRKYYRHFSCCISDSDVHFRFLLPLLPMLLSGIFLFLWMLVFFICQPRPHHFATFTNCYSRSKSRIIFSIPFLSIPFSVCV